ncbi:hypothetical protein C1646_696944 [Rhizophagus diaphanus]|nr:hypothetical protein C1646_696944 [Rhizophagus diaphanus] [Rhizophagus sp. MUCL 43196]
MHKYGIDLLKEWSHAKSGIMANLRFFDQHKENGFTLSRVSPFLVYFLKKFLF